MNNTLDLQTILAVITGVLFSASEALPFLNTDSNGLLHFLMNKGRALLKKNVDDETQPLLEPTNNHIAIDFEPITTTLSKTTNDTLHMIQNQNQLKQPSDYQLEFIISFIKTNYPKKCLEISFLTESNKNTLESNGYRVNNNTIEW